MSNYEEDSKELAYDLRMKYAEIVGSILEEIAFARKEKRFEDWFNWLDDLHTEINQKLNKAERIEYKQILSKTINVLNKYSPIYLGKSKDPEGMDIVHNALKELNLWLRDRMEKHNMFGAKDYEEGL